MLSWHFWVHIVTPNENGVFLLPFSFGWACDGVIGGALLYNSMQIKLWGTADVTATSSPFIKWMHICTNWLLLCTHNSSASRRCYLCLHKSWTVKKQLLSVSNAPGTMYVCMCQPRGGGLFQLNPQIKTWWIFKSTPSPFVVTALTMYKPCRHMLRLGASIKMACCWDEAECLWAQQ